MPNDQKLSQKINYLLQKYQLSQKDFADMVGVSPQAVTNWIKEKNGMDASVQERIQEMFDEPFEQIKMDDKALSLAPFGSSNFEEWEDGINRIAGAVTIPAFESFVRELLVDTLWVLIASEVAERSDYEWTILSEKIGEYATADSLAESLQQDGMNILKIILEDIRERNLSWNIRKLMLRANRCSQELRAVFPSWESEGSSLASAYRLSLQRMMFVTNQLDILKSI